MSFEGIPFPEVVLRDIADNAVRNLSSNQAVLDLIVGALPQRDKDSLRTALKKRPVQARIGYGLENPEDAQVTILLGNTSPTARTLGDVVGATEEVTTSIVTLPADISNAKGASFVAVETIASTTPLTGRVRLGDEVAMYSRVGQTVTLTARGVQHTEASFHYDGETAVFHDLSNRIGWGETCDLRVDALSSNPILNMVLAGTVKAALLLSAKTFNDAGLTLQSVRETDLAPRPQTWPAELLNRTLLVTVQRDFALPEAFDVLTRVDLQVDAEGLDDAAI